MVDPTLTDEEKTRLAFLAGCEFEYWTDPVTHAYVGKPKNPIGFLWDGQRWIVSESRDRRGLTGPTDQL